MGFEFNDLWKVPDLFSHENEDGILMTTDEWDNAEAFETIELAEYKREYLQANCEYVGFEIDPEYWHKQEKRFNTFISQLTLW